MNEFADFDENSILALMAILMLMAVWGCAIVGLDHWVWAGRSNSPSAALGALGAASSGDAVSDPTIDSESEAHPQTSPPSSR
jgi:hypothetical protein